MGVIEVYKSEWEWIKEKRKLFSFVIIAICVFLLIGAVKNDLFLEFQQSIFQEILVQMEGKSMLGGIGYIIMHNIISNSLSVAYFCLDLQIYDPSHETSDNNHVF